MAEIEADAAAKLPPPPPTLSELALDGRRPDADAPEFAAREFCVTKMVNINENFTRVAEARAAMNASRN